MSMSKLKLKSFPLGGLATNCYLLYDDLLKSALIVDAPPGVKSVLDYAKSLSLKVEALLLTHGHFDHIEGLDEIDLDFYIHPDGKQFLIDPNINASSLIGSPFKVAREPILFSEGTFKIANFNIQVIYTPGHTPDSVSLKIDDLLFSGDLLFFESIGRTDIPLASHDEIIDSIKNKILTLDDNISVFPGHGLSTTIGHEKDYNIFLK